MNNSAAEVRRRGALKTFIWAAVVAGAIFIPLIIYNRGYFLFLGDFNVQQIPFYQLAHKAVRSGEVFWNWHTDLGANFIGSYSFYLLFSPFFWLTLPFPNDMVPNLIGPLLILKTSLAALTAYFYIKRFVKDTDWAIVGGMLYAFSGFMTFNIFFNHFHDVCVFFPLLLISLEELVTNDRRGFFGFMVMMNCMVNYWFFIGEVVFVVIYVIVRMITGGWGCTFKKFMLIAFESILGVAMAAVFLLPSVMAIMGNPRTNTDSLLTGWLMWIYGFEQRFPAIIQSFFFPPEMPSRPNLFPDMGAQWSSLSAWLPLFSSTGVIAFCLAKKKNFHKRMIVTSMIMALVPIFNAAFVLFNNSYYARWFYMPILMMCVATVTALEERNTKRMYEGWKSSWNWVCGFILFFSAAIAFTPVFDKKKESYTFGLYGDKVGFWLLVAVAIACLILSAVLIFLLRRNGSFKRITCLMLSFVIVVFTTGYICSGKASKEYDDWFIDVPINGVVTLPDDEFARSDFYSCMDNLGMHFGLPNIQAFHSIVPVSTMEFYPYLGIKRDVSSKPPVEYDTLRSLLSVKWLFVATNEKEQHPMDGFELYDTQLGYNIYENQNFIPMGFAYDKAITKENMGGFAEEQIARHMISVLHLSDAAIIRNSDIIEEVELAEYSLLSADAVQLAVTERRDNSCYDFQIDARGFTARSELEKEMLMFFSVPYDEGWSASVNGQPAIIEKANVGFMAVRVPAGEATIRFDYIAPGLITGAKISAVGFGVMLLYLIIAAFVYRKPKGVSAEVKDTVLTSDAESSQAVEAVPGVSLASSIKPVTEVKTAPEVKAAPEVKPAKESLATDELTSYLESLQELPPIPNSDQPGEDKINE